MGLGGLSNGRNIEDKGPGKIQLKCSRSRDEKKKEQSLARDGAGELLSRDVILKGQESHVKEFKFHSKGSEE